MTRKLTAIIEREGHRYVALCPEVDVVSQGDTVSQARDNLEEAIALFFETASAEEIDGRLRDEVYVTQVEMGGWVKDDTLVVETTTSATNTATGARPRTPISSSASPG